MDFMDNVLQLPVGFKFEPKPDELVGFLRDKFNGVPLDRLAYPQFLDYDVYTDHPSNVLASTRHLRRTVGECAKDVSEEGYFFTPLNKTTTNGCKNTRSIIGHGTWLEKSKTHDVYDKVTGNHIGFRKYFKYTPPKDKNGKSVAKKKPKGDEWQMKEYLLSVDGVPNTSMVLCHITKKRKNDDTNTASTSTSTATSVGSVKRSRDDYENSNYQQQQQEYGNYYQQQQQQQQQQEYVNNYQQQQQQQQQEYENNYQQQQQQQQQEYVNNYGDKSYYNYQQQVQQNHEEYIPNITVAPTDNGTESMDDIINSISFNVDEDEDVPKAAEEQAGTSSWALPDDDEIDLSSLLDHPNYHNVQKHMMEELRWLEAATFA